MASVLSRRKFLSASLSAALGLITAKASVASVRLRSYEGQVRQALLSQNDIIKYREHCSANPQKLATIGRALGQQIRIKRNDSHYALYTVSEVCSEFPDTLVRMGEKGRKRLGTVEEFPAIIDAVVPHPSYSDEQARQHGEFVERLYDNGSHAGLVACAPHGGMIESGTDKQAMWVAEFLEAKGVSAWMCKGWKPDGGAFARWHITSTDIHRASFPLLNRIADRQFRYAVSFHGFRRSGIVIGGAAPQSLKRQIGKAIAQAVVDSKLKVKIVSGGRYGGVSRRNFVNWLTYNGRNGVQIEQGRVARNKYGQRIAEAVAEVYRNRI